ncbi:hypothetical protein CLHUN_22080 [Ruminiclostridium hungatei]|uniref:Uncharacterized protein n=1 Tax=Ruminiclostridium hungatei TaxID=48256 RepID=A0A1V4SKF9_RUMHU|nr:hypothetical protein [Ruminiclostridium hungatei]OPX43965.1 hypothetical protein CLHUN_22080 [Ruminiclostridium hungatei]
METLDRLYQAEKELNALGLLLAKDFPHYFCTPLNAVIFAQLGTDGIHYCIIKGEKELENSPVYVVSPMMPGHYVELVGRNLIDFLSLVISCKDASALEYISYAPKDKFEEFIDEIRKQQLDDWDYNKRVEAAVNELQNAFGLQNIEDVYCHVNETKSNLSYHANMAFSKEYSDSIG